jgi:hypothetical protein
MSPINVLNMYGDLDVAPELVQPPYTRTVNFLGNLESTIERGARYEIGTLVAKDESKQEG